ncbi:DUF4240 domain-containing protein [Actinacidiphila guanduensis]|uniref:DUF4240 domain-containing protein n=1 Tax=Actinacidiphila guanduensis TaxID=310781 RepID=A0A1H0IT60_9ACTN|nr:DUF4240 domain-containing protein [Actinacidiphila guanduensis]SDO34627.1 Protein of unknown function [Actinacidiphila guanduensis]
MDDDEFWGLIDKARAQADGADSADPAEGFAPVLVELLTGRSAEEILDYQERFAAAHRAVHREDVWAAAHLIGGGCSDDAFIDFRAGLIALGRDWYERVAACPDELAEHPLVRAAAATGDDYAVFSAEAGYCAAAAYLLSHGDTAAFHAAWDRRHPEPQRPGPPAGERFDVDDPAEMARRLPRLSALFAL